MTTKQDVKSIDQSNNSTSTTSSTSTCNSKPLRLLTELNSHIDRAWSLAWNPRLPILATCSTDKNINIYSYNFNTPSTSTSTATSTSTSSIDKATPSAPTFQLKETVESGHSRTVRQVSWSPSGTILATSSFDNTVGIWQRLELEHDHHQEDDHDHDHHGHDGQEWECIGTLEGHESECKSVAWSQNGNLLASCSRDKTVWVWEVQPDAEFETLSVLMEHSQDVKAVTWHPKEELLASASYDDTIKLYIDDPSDDWFCMQTLTGHTSTIWSISFSPCGSFLCSVSDDQTIRIWRRLKKSQLEKLNLNDRNLNGNLPGREGEKWFCTNVLKGWHDRCIFSCDWKKGGSSGKEDEEEDQRDLGRIATAGGDGKICVFQVTLDPDPTKLAPLTTLIASMTSAHGSSDINCISWAPWTLSSSSSSPLLNGSVLDPNTPSIEEMRTEEQERNQSFMKDVLATVADDGSVKVWCLEGTNGWGELVEEDE